MELRATVKENPSTGDRISCLVLGCGDVGFEVACRLKESGIEVTIVDKNWEKIDVLRSAFHAFVGDFGSPGTLQKAGIERSNVVVITTSKCSETRRALEAINQVKAMLNVRPFVLALIYHGDVESEARKLGATDVVPSIQTIANAIVDKVGKLKSRAFREELLNEMARKDWARTDELFEMLAGKDYQSISEEDFEKISRALTSLRAEFAKNKNTSVNK